MATGTATPALTTWDPSRYLRRVDRSEVELSRGFLRCRPERWFPGFAVQWAALSHALGAEIRVVDVRPVTAVPAGLRTGFAGTVDGEPVALFVDREGEEALCDALVPDAPEKARRVVTEYVARRFLAGLAMSWSGPESSVVKWTSRADPAAGTKAGGIRVVCLVNGRQCSGWIALGPSVVGRLDGLWRRQIRSTTRSGLPTGEIRLEVAQLAVPPALLADYTRSGTVIDLEVAMTDTVTLRHAGRAWLAARICDVEGNLGFEVLPTPVANPGLPEGATRVSIQFPPVRCDAALTAEISQPGAMMDTGRRLGPEVEMVIHGEPVARGELKAYEGRFALGVS